MSWSSVPTVGSELLTMRTTEQEKNRLEELRVSLGLTSKSQVLRAALDALELVVSATDFTPASRQETRDVMSLIRFRLDIATPAEMEQIEEVRERLRTGGGAR